MSLFTLYSKLPVRIQDWLIQLYSFKVEKQRFGREYKEILISLKESEKWTEKQIREYKEANLKKILEYAYNHTPFYKNSFDRHGVKPSDFNKLEDIEKFPVLTKEEVRENWKKMVSDEFSEKDLIRYHTSGSTGKALDFYWTKHNLQYYWATVSRGRFRFGIDELKKPKHLNLTGKIVVPLSQNKPPYWRFRRAQNQYMLNMQHITPNKIHDIVEFINKEKFEFFVGYPSILNSLATAIREAGLEIINPPRFFFSSAEKLYNFQKKNIAEVFKNTQFVEHYGFSENAGGASQAPDGLYYEDFELGHLELIDTIENEDSVTGTLLATGFQNLGMPFIRYNVGDTATFKKEPGLYLSSAVIEKIEGRTEDYIITPEGSKITRLDYIFKGTNGIREAQVIQSKLGEITVKYIGRDNFSPSELTKIEEVIKNSISPSLKINFEKVNEIPRTQSGKFKAVVSFLKDK